MRKNDLFGSANVIGTIRRVDDLGRIVIPMEIRKELGLFAGQPCAVIPYQDVVIIKVADTGLKSDLHRLIEKYDMNYPNTEIISKLKTICEEASNYDKFEEYLRGY